MKGDGSKMIEKDKHKIKYFIMGLIVVLLPFTTPDTVAILGYPKSKLVGKILGGYYA